MSTFDTELLGITGTCGIKSQRVKGAVAAVDRCSRGSTCTRVTVLPAWILLIKALTTSSAPAAGRGWYDAEYGIQRILSPVYRWKRSLCILPREKPKRVVNVSQSARDHGLGRSVQKSKCRNANLTRHY
jgi:hypothetical protein